MRFHKFSSFAILTALALGALGGSCGDTPTKPPDGGLAQFIDLNPAWSTDGSRIAFWSAEDSAGLFNPGIYIIDTLGGPRQFTGFSGIGLWAEWLPGDSELIIFRGQLYHFNLNTQVETPLGIFPRFPPFDVSPNGEIIYYEGPKIDSSSAGGIYSYDRVSGQVSAIVAGGNPAVDIRGVSLAISRSPLLVFSMRDSTLTRLADEGILPEWCDSTEIIYTAGNDLWITDLGGRRQYLGTSNRGKLSCRLSDGRILHERVASDNTIRIWSIERDGTGLEQLTY